MKETQTIYKWRRLKNIRGKGSEAKAAKAKAKAGGVSKATGAEAKAKAKATSKGGGLPTGTGSQTRAKVVATQSPKPLVKGAKGKAPPASPAVPPTAIAELDGRFGRVQAASREECKELEKKRAGKNKKHRVGKK